MRYREEKKEKKDKKKKKEKSWWSIILLVLILLTSIALIVLLSITLAYAVKISVALTGSTTLPSRSGMKSQDEIIKALGPNRIQSKSKDPTKFKQYMDMLHKAEEIEDDVFLYNMGEVGKDHKHYGKGQGPLFAKIRVARAPGYNGQFSFSKKSRAPKAYFRKANLTATSSAVTSTQCQPGFTVGVKLPTDPPMQYMVNTDNHEGASADYIIVVVEQAVNNWNSLSSYPVYGSRITWAGSTNPADQPDGLNEIYFGDSGASGILGLTTTYAFSNDPNPANRRILEFDILIDDVNHPFGNARLNPAVYDLLRILTHESGHGTGNGDVDMDGCSPYTIMYGFSSLGQYLPDTPLAADTVTFYAQYPQPTTFTPQSPPVSVTSDGLLIPTVSVMLFLMTVHNLVF